MDNRAMKLLIAGIAGAAALAASADVIRLRGGGTDRARGAHGERTVFRVSYRHVPLSDPNDPFHDTYERNLGRRRDVAPKPVANIRAKVSAARYDEERAEERRAERERPKGAYYSNVKTRVEEAEERRRYAEASGAGL